MKHFYKLDWHTPTHLFGSYFLARLLGITCEISMWQAALFALFFGILWECLDESFAGEWIFDPRGFDIGDVAADAVGCLLAIWI